MLSFLLALMVAAAPAQPLPVISPPPPQPRARLSDLAWLEGRWRTALQRTPTCGRRWTEEIWTDAAAGIMFGASRTACASYLTEFEQMRIMSGNDGRIYFLAAPNGAAATQFSLTRIGPQTVTFANESHDYPQLIRYWREGNELVAEIALKDGTKARQWRFQPVGR